MAQEQGLVSSITNDGWAEVIINRNDAHAEGGKAHCCSAMGSSGRMVSKAVNRAGAHEGDLVSLSIGSGTMVKSAMALYLLPIFGLVAGGIAGLPLGAALNLDTTTAGLVFGFAGLALGFAATVVISRFMADREEFSPEITGVITPALRPFSPTVALDPVCRMDVDTAKAPAKWVYGDKTYYFCHLGCKNAFVMEPERYLLT
jgi:YHS domain-containing protein/positive regulator of sigma E activity